MISGTQLSVEQHRLFKGWPASESDDNNDGDDHDSDDYSNE